MSKKVYLCGAMEYTDDNGAGWRQEYKERLERTFDFKCIVPEDYEEDIIGDCNIRQLKKDKIDEYIITVRKLIDRDIQLVEESDLIICNWNGEMSSGTFHEAGHAYLKNKESFLVTSFNFCDVPGWFLSCFSNAFKSLDDLVAYLDYIGIGE